MQKCCVVTGATSGIGREIALGLARTGAKLVLVGRDPARTEASVRELRTASGNPDLTGMVADLSLQHEVRGLAARIRAHFTALDVLVNNAGAVHDRRVLTSEGFERTWALNHLAYVTLTLELLDALQASPQGRVINIASGMHARGRIRFDNLQGESGYRRWAAYSQSKLANVLFTYALARRLAGTRLTANCVRPGAVASGFGRGLTGGSRALLWLLRPLMLKPAQGADTALYLATVAEPGAINGQYWFRRQCRTSSALSLDQALQEKLWRLSVEQCGSSVPA